MPDVPNPERRIALSRRWFALHPRLMPCRDKTPDTTQDESGIWYNAASGTTRLMTWDLVEHELRENEIMAGVSPQRGTGRAWSTAEGANPSPTEILQPKTAEDAARVALAGLHRDIARGLYEQTSKGAEHGR